MSVGRASMTPSTDRLLCATRAAGPTPSSVAVAPFATVRSANVQMPTPPPWRNAIPAITWLCPASALGPRVRVPEMLPSLVLKIAVPDAIVIDITPAVVRSSADTGGDGTRTWQCAAPLVEHPVMQVVTA